ncbi:hypothetical protein DIPPA_11846 [Diplonema papillatum]|nr:hypothetical protein DIPPA_11846 [Diplonema papillatum]
MADDAAVFNCTACNTPKRFEHPSWKTRQGAETFCNQCRKVTYHKNPAVQQQTTTPARVPTVPIDALWNDFVQRLSGISLSPEELGGATTSTVHELMRELGFDALSSARLQTELQFRAPRAPSQTPPAAATLSSMPSQSQLQPQPSVGRVASNMSAGGPQAPNSTPGAQALQPMQSAGGLSAAVSQPGAYSPSLSPAPDAMTSTGTAVAQPVTFADGTTSVTDFVDNDVLRLTQKTMEDELRKMDEELEKLRAQVGKSTGQQQQGQPGEGDEEGNEAGETEDKEEEKKEKPTINFDISIPYPELATERISAEMWPILVERLAACGLTEADVSSCTTLTFEKVLLFLSFNPLERARLIKEFTARYGTNATSAGPDTPDEKPRRPPIDFDLPEELDNEATPGLVITGPPTGANLPALGGRIYDTQTNLKNEPLLIDASALHRWPNWNRPGWARGSAASAQPPSESNFDDEGLEPVSKCPGHSDRDVEFWCVECEALVCSLCHITGSHKDHPFISIHEAARKECAGLGDWQTRASATTAKLQDAKVSLDEVHQNIDDYHQQQINSICDAVDNLKDELEVHKNNLVRRVQGHAAAQHQLFHPSEERIRTLRHGISSALNKIDGLLTANPEVMNPEDSKKWGQGIMKVRATIGDNFADAVNHPVVLPNYTSLKFNNEVVPDDLFSKVFLTKVPTPLSMPSYLEMRDLSHPLFPVGDRINFTWTTPELTDHTKSPITLSNNQLTASFNGTGSGHVLFKGTATFEAGRHYWEVRIDAMHNDNRLGTHVIVGLVAEGTGSMGSTTGLAWCVDKLSGMVPMSLECPPWTPGSLLGVFLDLELNRVGLYYNRQCVAHVAIPAGRYTPAASIHCSHDQVTLIPLADIPTGVTLTSGLSIKGAVHRLPAGSIGRARALTARSPPPHTMDMDPEISYLQEECLKLRQSVHDTKRELVEQQRVIAQQNFHEQQIKDLKGRIDETAKLMAQQSLAFEVAASEDLKKLQDIQKNQLEEETKRVWQMQAETASRTQEVQAASEAQKVNSSRLEQFLREQQVQITQQMLEKQQQEQQLAQRELKQAQQQVQQQRHMQQQQMAHQHQHQQLQASMLLRRNTNNPAVPVPGSRVSPPRQAGTSPYQPTRHSSPVQPALPGAHGGFAPATAQRPPSNHSNDSTLALREFIDFAGRLT